MFHSQISSWYNAMLPQSDDAPKSPQKKTKPNMTLACILSGT